MIYTGKFRVQVRVFVGFIGVGVGLGLRPAKGPVVKGF